MLEPGKKIALFGKVEIDTYTGDLTMLHPEIEILDSEDDAESLASHRPHRADLRGGRQDHDAHVSNAR